MWPYNTGDSKNCPFEVERICLLLKREEFFLILEGEICFQKITIAPPPPPPIDFNWHVPSQEDRAILLYIYSSSVLSLVVRLHLGESVLYKFTVWSHSTSTNYRLTLHHCLVFTLYSAPLSATTQTRSLHSQK